jgi:hypothetical protein
MDFTEIGNGRGVNSSGCGPTPVADFCEHNNDHSCSTIFFFGIRVAEQLVASQEGISSWSIMNQNI